MEAEELVAFALRRVDRVRLAMRDKSMLPLLHEPQVLEIVAADGKLRIGQIVVFRRGDRLFAHRIVRIKGEALWCAGDAQPGRMELVQRDAVLGVVDTVRSMPGENAPRVDGVLFRLHGTLLAMTRLPRAWLVNAHPPLRPRVYPALFDAVSAIVREDAGALAQSIRAVDPLRFAAVAERHRCGPLIVEGLRALPNDDLARGLSEQLKSSRWATALRTTKLREQLTAVLGILNSSQIEPVLLKGAARLWKRETDFELHDSSDLDLLVAPHEMGSARKALFAAGYRENDADGTPAFYREHRHAPPLYPPGHGVSVELHRALASVKESTIPTASSDLERFLDDVSTADIRVRALNPTGMALHLILHGRERPLLRDVYLIARLLQQMSDRERETLRVELARERRETVPLHALAALAARCAGIEWPIDERTARYCEWVMLREDLPRPLRARPECFDAWAAAEARPVSRVVGAAWRAADVRAAKSGAERLRAPLRVVAFLGAGAAIAVYVSFMRER